ncbi:hypothetical protein A9Q83_04690 [Alphaproteobacteria bacterium 46_93_T64]|nr:hypothetical protein A9Q83_04690 [Alphaproteobacteria bacterium 46_93_T64]
MKINNRIIIPNIFSLMLVITSLLFVTFEFKTESRTFEKEAQKLALANRLTFKLHDLHKHQSEDLLNYSFTSEKSERLKEERVQQQISSTIARLQEVVSNGRPTRMLARYIKAIQGNIQIGQDLINAIDSGDSVKEKAAFLRWKIKGRHIKAALSDLTNYYRASLRRDIERTKLLSENLVQIVFVVIAGSLLISALSVIYYRRTIVTPIVYFKEAVDKIADGNFDVAVKETVIRTGGEIGDLALAVNRLGKELHSTTISRNVLAEEVLFREQIQQKLERSNADLDDFAHIVSHDLKAPLRAIRSLADIICDDYEDVLDDEGKECLMLMKARAERMHNLIVGIMDYSRFGRAEVIQEHVEMNTLAREIIDTLAPPNNIQIEIQENLKDVYGSRTQIMQVFQNLLSNAIKFMDKENGVIKLGCSDKGDHFQYFVEDNGPGIAQEYFEKIFKIFQTLNARDNVESTGVGLSIISKIVELHGGTTWLESVLGQGSTFFVTFPKHNLGDLQDE